jgi:quercetin dioxygenase-like cupin family protein
VTRLGLVDQEVAPGVGAPDHTHDYDEAITVIEGSAEIWIGEERWEAGPGTTAFIPAGAVHGFRNSGDGQLRVQATMNANELRATFVSPSGGTAPGS